MLSWYFHAEMREKSIAIYTKTIHNFARISRKEKETEVSGRRNYHGADKYDIEDSPFVHYLRRDCTRAPYLEIASLCCPCEYPRR